MVTVQLTSTEPAEPLLDLEKYSRLRKVLRVTGWVKRFITNAPSNQKNRGELTAEEITAARKWISSNQEKKSTSAQK